MRMIRYTLMILALGFPLAGQAQTSESEQADRGYIQGFLEDSLSDAGRDVRVIGFSGALSSRATIEELTIADDEGIWLTLRGVTLDWNRMALLRGAIDITELAAEEILLPRAPITDDSLPAAEAKGFSLPELPVSVKVEKLSIAQAVIGAPLLGQEAIVTLSGSAILEGGEGTATINAQRIDESLGRLRLEGSYANATGRLSLDTELTEGPDGIAATMLDLPGRPSVKLQIKGDGPANDFAADIALDTDGENRLAGRVSLTAAQPEGDDPAQPLDMLFNAEVGGDIAPAFAPEYRGFFGPDIRLVLSGTLRGSGETVIDTLSLSANQLDLKGQLRLSATGWPEYIALEGMIEAPDGAPVLLPLNGHKTTLERAAISLDYDHSAGNEWQAEVALDALHRDDLSIEAATLKGNGILVSGTGPQDGGLSGDLIFEARGVDPTDPALARALGSQLSGNARLNWDAGAPLEVSAFTFTGADYGMTGQALFKGLRDALQLQIDGALTLTAGDLSRFDGLVNMPISGSAQMRFAGEVSPLAGTLDMSITGSGRDIGIGQPRIDPLLKGRATLGVNIIRDEEGTRVQGLSIATDATALTGEANLRSAGSTLQMQLDLADVAPLLPGAAGPAGIALSVLEEDKTYQIEANASAPGRTSVTTTGTIRKDADGHHGWTGRAELAARDLSPYSEIAGRVLRGALSLEAEGTVDLNDFSLALDLAAQGEDLAIAQPYADQILRGQSSANARLERTVEGKLRVEKASFNSPQLSSDFSAEMDDGGQTSATAKAVLRDLGLFVDGLRGPLTLNGSAQSTAQGWRINADGNGPGGITTSVSGTASADGQNLALDMNGVAPLALANPFISPRTISGLARYDLRLDGPPTLASLSGTVNTTEARTALPQLRLALENINATARLAGGRANITANGQANTGGAFDISGQVGLMAPNNSDLTMSLREIGYSQDGLFETRLNGSITVMGALAGGARIGGMINIDTVEMRIPDGQAAAIGSLPDLRHLHEPAPVHTTRARAGLLNDGSSESSSYAGPVYPLDLRINAPARIFVRGRGLDAEMGGRLRLSGTTGRIIPDGHFELIRGRIDILGKRLDLTEGDITIRGDFDPYIRLVAETQAGDVLVRIGISGLASDPEVTFTSVPDLPQEEVLSQLLFGRALDKISPLQAVQLASAVATLAGKGGGGIVNRLRENFGLDDLDVTTAEDGTAQARIGKYISDKAYTDVTVDSTGKTEINLNLTLTPSLTAKGTVGTDGNTGIGVYYEKDY